MSSGPTRPRPWTSSTPTTKRTVISLVSGPGQPTLGCLRHPSASLGVGVVQQPPSVFDSQCLELDLRRSPHKVCKISSLHPTYGVYVTGDHKLNKITIVLPLYIYPPPPQMSTLNVSLTKILTPLLYFSDYIFILVFRTRSLQLIVNKVSLKCYSIFIWVILTIFFSSKHKGI